MWKSLQSCWHCRFVWLKGAVYEADFLLGFRATSQRYLTVIELLLSPPPIMECSEFFLGPNPSPPQGFSWAHRGHHTKAQLEFLTGKNKISPKFFLLVPQSPIVSRGLVLICNKSLTKGWDLQMDFSKLWLTIWTPLSSLLGPLELFATFQEGSFLSRVNISSKILQRELFCKCFNYDLFVTFMFPLVSSWPIMEPDWATLGFWGEDMGSNIQVTFMLAVFVSLNGTTKFQVSEPALGHHSTLKSDNFRWWRFMSI